MGKQTGIYLMGKSANILYYNWKTIPCQRTIPAVVYQSPEVIIQQNAVGLSTTMGASFRKLLANVLPYPKNMKMQIAVRMALLKWMKEGPVPSEPPGNNIPFISELSFNEAAVLKKCLDTPPTLTLNQPGELALHIPAMVPTSAFDAPGETDYIRLTTAVACCDITTGKAIDSNSSDITIPYNGTGIPSKTISLPVQMPVNSLTMVVVALEYFSTTNGISSLIQTKRFRPSEVVGGVVR